MLNETRRRCAPLELSRVLKKRFGPPTERSLGSAEGSLEKFSQVTHFPRAESLDRNIYSEVILRNLGLTVVSGIW